MKDVQPVIEEVNALTAEGKCPSVNRQMLGGGGGVSTFGIELTALPNRDSETYNCLQRRT